MQLGQNAIGKPNSKDFFDGFGKEIFLQSKARLDDCYKILNNAPYNLTPFKFRLWRNAIRYIEGKISKQEFLNVIRKFL